MAVIHVTEASFERDILKAEGTVLVDFWATWCGPCQMIAPLLEEIAKERPDVTVAKINVDEEPSLAGAFQIVSIPTLLVVKNGKIVNQAVGYRPKADILALL